MASVQGRPPTARLSAYYFAYFSYIGIFMPYFALYLERKGYPATEIGMLMAVMQVMRLVAPNLWGALADRLGRRMPIVRLAALLSCAGYAGLLLADSFWPTAIALAVMGFFWTAQNPLTEALTFAHLRAQPERYGRVRAWGSFGFVVTATLMGWWLERAVIDWVVWGGVVTLGAVVVLAFTVPEAPEAPHRHTEARLTTILRRREVQAFFVACMLMTAAHGALYVFYSIHLVEAGYSKTAVGLLWTLGVVAEILAFLVAPRLLARWGLHAILMATFAAAALRFLLIGWYVELAWLIVLAQCMHGITFGAFHSAAVAHVHRWFGERNQAQGQALYGSLSFGAGGILGSLVSGWAWAAFGPGWTYTLGSLFALLGLMVLWAGRGGQTEALQT